MEYLNGIPVYDTIVTLEVDQDDHLVDITGTLVHGMDSDLRRTQNLSLHECFEIAVARESDEELFNIINNPHVSYSIYIDASVARLVCLVDFLIDNAHITKRPFYVIDAHTGKVVENWNGLATFNCPGDRYKSYGGNVQKGKIKYGVEPYCLNMRIENEICHLENRYVRIVDMNFTKDSSLHRTAFFPCKNGYDDEVNKAYSPAVDAFFYGTIVGKMFEDWFQTTALGNQIIICVHYSKSYVGAFWNGENCTFGDGDYSAGYFPFTVMDMIAHEIAHGVTEFASGLHYFMESGGVNEAFSDIIGEATKEYFGSANFLFGADCTTGDYAIREFRDPHNDNVSIAHVNEMSRMMDPHHSSGIFRRAFYVIVKQKHFNLRNAVEVFLYANRMYWHHNTTFANAACSVIKAAYDLGFPVGAFEKGFQDVGISPCYTSGRIRALANNRTYKNIITSQEKMAMFSFEAPPFYRQVFISASGANGLVRISVSSVIYREGKPTQGSTLTEGYSYVTIQNSGKFYIRLSTDASAIFRNITLTAGYF